MKYSILILFALMTSVSAEEAPTKGPQCFPREALTNQMIRSGASPILVAPMGDNLFEVWSDGARWSAFLTKRSPAVSCPVAGGEGEPHLAEPICVDPVRCPRV